MFRHEDRALILEDIRMPAGNPVKKDWTRDEIRPAHIGVDEAGDHLLAFENNNVAAAGRELEAVSRLLKCRHKPPVGPSLPGGPRRVVNETPGIKQVQHLGSKSLREPEFTAVNAGEPELEGIEFVAQAEENTPAERKLL